jgi:DNA-binding NarL/FixJ family response regulator
VTGVLVCDDAPDMRAMLRDALSADPGLHVVGEAADGTAALALAATLQPDVVLLDIGMPGPGADAVVAGVKRVAPDAAIVVLSGYGPERLDPIASGQISAHLPKTADLAALRRTLLAAGARADRYESSSASPSSSSASPPSR